jgi:hypothetical protein
VAYFCRNHPNIETDTLCARCAQPFCDACLVEILGQRYCAPCRDMQLREMQGLLPGQTAQDAPLAGTGTVDMGRWLSAGWALIKDDLGAFAIAALLSGLLSVLTCYILLGPMMCGMYMMVYRKMTYGRVEIGNLFDGFRRAGWAILASILLLAIQTVTSFVAAFPAGILQGIGQAQHNTGLVIIAQVLSAVLSTVIGAVVSGATFFMMPHIAARNVNPIDALTASFEVFRRNILMFSVAGFVFSLIGVAGLIGCVVGALITMPLMMAAEAQAYADHFGIAGWDRT